MSEKRSPSIKLKAEVGGKKTIRVELFHASLWPDMKWSYKFTGHRGADVYRVRNCGKWWNSPGKRFTWVTLSDALRIFNQSVNNSRQKQRQLDRTSTPGA